MDQNKKIDIALFIVGLAITYIGVFFLIDLVWVGAEYVFEGSLLLKVHALIHVNFH